MSVKDNYPAIRPSLLLDFANTKTLDPRITFSRASTGTYYDGVTHAKAEENLLRYSQEFDNAYWNKGQVTITANATTAPDGTTTAESLVEETSTNTHFIWDGGDGVTVSSGTTYVISVFVKASGSNWFQLSGALARFGANQWANFDVTNGVVGNVGSDNPATTITNVGNGWYRCSIEVTATASGGGSFILFLTNDLDAATRAPSYAGSGASEIYIWGAQVEERDSLTAYTATTTQPITNYIPVLQSAAAGEARFDHDPVTGESKGLLIEEQRTNLVQRSEEFDNAYWNKSNASIDSNVIVAPNGDLTGDKLVENTASNTHSVFNNTQQTITNGVSYVLSCYAKSAERTKVAVMVFGGNAWGGTRRLIVDLTDGSVVNTTGLDSSSVVHIGNDWYRITATATATGSTGNAGMAVYPVSDSYTLDNFGQPTYTGDGYSGVYIWGAQLEAGAFPTSYIKTTSAQVTRNADSASMTGTNFSEWFNPGEGTLFADYVMGESNNPQSPFAIDDATLTNRINLYADSTTGADRIPQALVTTSGTAQAGFNFGTVSENTSHKMALAYKPNDFAGSFDGGTVQTDSSGVVPVVTGAGIGSARSIAPAYMNGTIKRLTYYPARLTNAQLQALTEG